MKKKTPSCSSKDGENETCFEELLCEKKMQKDKFRGSSGNSIMQERKMKKDDRAFDEKRQILCVLGKYEPKCPIQLPFT